MITYLTLAMCLFPEDDYAEVATKVTGSLDRWNCWNAAWTAPTASAITQARKRLGRNVLPELFDRADQGKADVKQSGKKVKDAAKSVMK